VIDYLAYVLVQQQAWQLRPGGCGPSTSRLTSRLDETVGGFRNTRYRGLEQVDFAIYLVDRLQPGAIDRGTECGPRRQSCTSRP
jgi:hypothetical protein